MNEKAQFLKTLIKNRRSIFPASYVPGTIPEEFINQVLESANYAPTHKLTEPWRFTVFTGSGLDKLGAALQQAYKITVSAEKFLQKKFDSLPVKCKQSACIIAICGNFHTDKVPEWEEIAAIGCAVQNMALTAEALNIGAYWSSPGILKAMSEFLNLKENEKCLGFFYMGYHNAPHREAIRTPIEEKVKWIRA